MSTSISNSTGLIAATGRPRLTAPERNFLRSLAYAAIVVFVFWCGYKLERDILHRRPADIRYIREASEAAMRYITIPHIIIGFLFMISSPRNRTARQRAWALALLLAGAGLCAIYYQGGGKTNLLLYAGVYLYFMVHELRDEARFYTVLGDAAPIPDKRAFSNMVRALTALIVFSAAAVAWTPAPFGVYLRKVAAPDAASTDATGRWALVDGSLPLAVKLALAAAPLLLAAIGFAIVFRRSAAKLGHASVRQLFSTHAPLFRVMFGVAGVLVLSLLITRRAYSLILFHVVAWYVFAAYQFARHPPQQPPHGWWTWMRTTITGFKTLHIGMVVVLMAIGLTWTLAWDLTPTLHWLLAPESFLYWTIMHITVSFVPR